MGEEAHSYELHHHFSVAGQALKPSDTFFRIKRELCKVLSGHLAKAWLPVLGAPKVCTLSRWNPKVLLMS